MNQNSIRLAFAANQNNQIVDSHFGEAEKYLLYEWNECDLIYLKEVQNPLKDFEEENQHGNRKKGNGIINLLKQDNVDVVISKQFGKNIKMVNQHFVPVIVRVDTPSETYDFLKTHIEWIRNELEKDHANYDLLI